MRHKSSKYGTCKSLIWSFMFIYSNKKLIQVLYNSMSCVHAYMYMLSLICIIHCSCVLTRLLQWWYMCVTWKVLLCYWMDWFWLQNRYCMTSQIFNIFHVYVYVIIFINQNSLVVSRKAKKKQHVHTQPKQLPVCYLQLPTL